MAGDIPEGHCPKAEDVPSRLMFEYLDMASSPMKPIWTLDRPNMGDRDYYWVSAKLYVGLEKGADPHGPNVVDSIKYIGNMLGDPLERKDQYEHGKRTETSFVVDNAAMRTSYTATFEHVGGREHVVSEYGSFYKHGASELTDFRAEFDSKGKLVSYLTGSSWGDLKETPCSSK